MDAWYAAKEVMLQIAAMGKRFYCPLKSNRLVDDSGGEQLYRRIEDLSWSEAKLEGGKLVKVRGFAGDFKVKLFWVEVSYSRTHRTGTLWVMGRD